MINRVNDVTIKIKVGANAKIAKMITIFIVFTNCAGSSIAETDKLIKGAWSAAKSENDNKMMDKIIFNKIPK